MNKTRKVELLYKIAKGEGGSVSPQERKELKKYKVDDYESSFCVTKKNISEYVTAVDNGSRLSFYDWCLNNGKADRRRRGSSKEDIKKVNIHNTFVIIIAGSFPWLMAISAMSRGALSNGACIMFAAIISAVLYNIGRKVSFLTLFILPVILTTIVAM